MITEEKRINYNKRNNKGREYCKKDHKLTLENTIYTIKNYRGEDRLYKECRICHNDRNKKYEETIDITRVKKFRHIKRTYNITEEDYNNLLHTQNYKCLICNRHTSKLRVGLCIDHDHKSNTVRGLLCRKCNGALGWYEEFKDSINNYLKLSKDDK